MGSWSIADYCLISIQFTGAAETLMRDEKRALNSPDLFQMSDVP